MLYEIEILEARRIAELAAVAREARDRCLAPVPEAELGEPRPARGEHHAAGSLGFAGVPEDEPAHLALRGNRGITVRYQAQALGGDEDRVRRLREG